MPLCTSTAPSWPAAPLVDLVGGPSELARLLGWKKAGGIRDRMITDECADRWAITCGFHPEQVWPGWCDAGLTAGDRHAIESGGWRPAWEWMEARRVEALAVAS